ncbi:MAG: recombinase RecA [Clostridiaceae bacterium]|nr:recombinase RecA [Clostridiaceae bacterium]
MAKRRKLAKSKQISKPQSESERQEALRVALAKIEKEMGKGAVMLLGDDDYDLEIDTVSTGALSLDLALGIGGLPKGRVVEIFGPESSGKTTVALHVIAEAQKAGGIAAFVDAEHALDPTYAEKIGVDIDNLIISQPDNGEEALEVAEALARSGAIDVIVVDSVAALVPRSEIEGEMGDATMGVQARLMSQALRKLSGVLHKSNTMIIFINQLREKIGIMFGNPETTTGGRALKFYASVRLDIRKIETLRDGQDIIGSRTRVKVVKNKVAPPFKEAEFDIIYGKGISQEGCILDLAADIDVINKSGSWYSYGDTRIGQGRDNARQWLVHNPEVMAEIDAKVREYYEPEEDDDISETAEPDQIKDTNDNKVLKEPDDLDELLNLDL